MVLVLINIASMLKENPKSRPNIYQVLREACMMQGIETPVKDVCDPDNTSLLSNHNRSTLDELNLSRAEINNCLLQKPIFPPLLLLEQYFHLPNLKNRSSQKSFPCGEGGL